MMTSVYGPMPAFGDVNYDERIDAFDLIQLRRILPDKNPPPSYDGFFNEDVNDDGSINIANLVALSQYLMGQRDRLGGGSSKIKKNKIKVIYDEAVQPATEKETSPIDLIPQPEYGPPYPYDPEEPAEEPAYQVEEPAFQEVYGPPSFFRT